MQRKIQAHLASLPKTQASFIEPMKCLPVSKLPEDSNFVWEIKLDVAPYFGGARVNYSPSR